MKKSLIALALVLASLPVAASAQPQDWNTVMKLDVPYGDLNLANPTGAQTMLRRIKYAAVRVCGGTPETFDIRARSQFRICVRDATQNAVAQLNAPLVTALYNGRPLTDPRFAYEGR